MPIVGLTDKKAAIVEIGQIRKGGPKTDPKKPGPDLQHFRFESNNTDLVAAFKALYGDQPKAISVILPYETVDEVFEAWREEYTAAGLKHRCDGETCVLWLQNNNTYSTEPIPCPTRGQRDGCKAVGRLKVIIPDLGHWGVITVHTTSKHDIINIQRNLLALQQGVGRLTGIRLWLRRVPVKITTPTAEGRARREKWLIQIEPAKEWVAAYLATSEQRALNSAQGVLPAAQQLALNPAPMEIEEEDEDGEVLEGEVLTAEQMQLIGDIKALYLECGKTEEEWSGYFEEKGIASRTLDGLKELREKLKAHLRTLAKKTAA